MSKSGFRKYIDEKVDDMFCEYMKLEGIVEKKIDPDYLELLDELKAKLCNCISHSLKDAPRGEITLFPVKEWKIANIDASDYAYSSKYYSVYADIVIGKIGDYNIMRTVEMDVMDINDGVDDIDDHSVRWRFYSDEPVFKTKGVRMDAVFESNLRNIFKNSVVCFGMTNYVNFNLENAAVLVRNQLKDENQLIYSQIMLESMPNFCSKDGKLVPFSQEQQEIKDEREGMFEYIKGVLDGISYQKDVTEGNAMDPEDMDDMEV